MKPLVPRNCELTRAIERVRESKPFILFKKVGTRRPVDPNRGKRKIKVTLPTLKLGARLE